MSLWTTMIGNWTIDQWKIWIGLTILVSLFCWLYIKFYRRSTTPEGAKNNMHKALEKFAKPRKFRVLSGVRLEHGGKVANIDHMLVGSFGILFVATIHEGVVVYGEPRGEMWRMKERNLDRRFPNPLLQMEEDMEVVRRVISQKDIYNVPMECVAVFTERSMTPELNLSGAPNAIIGKDLKGYLKLPRFQKESDVDIEKVCAAIEEANLNN